MGKTTDKFIYDMEGPLTEWLKILTADTNRLSLGLQKCNETFVAYAEAYDKAPNKVAFENQNYKPIWQTTTAKEAEIRAEIKKLAKECGQFLDKIKGATDKFETQFKLKKALWIGSKATIPKAEAAIKDAKALIADGKAVRDSLASIR